MHNPFKRIPILKAVKHFRKNIPDLNTPVLKEAHMKSDEEGTYVDATYQSPAVPAIVKELVLYFEVTKGINTIQGKVYSEEIGPLTVTVQRDDGFNPMDIIAKMRTALERINAIENSGGIEFVRARNYAHNCLKELGYLKEGE